VALRVAPRSAPGSSAEEEKRFADARARMVRTIAAQTGIADERLLGAFRRVARHRFLPSSLAARAYEDVALPLGHRQTISQPSMIAVMLDALRVLPNDRVLEIGAGSGYAAALLGALAREVFAVEIMPELAKLARQHIRDLEIDNVEIVEGNGRQGLREFGPYDKILVSAGSEDVPDELVHELDEGGRIAIPVGDDAGQRLRVGTKVRGAMYWETSIPCIFVPLVGAATGNKIIGQA
jgi:protein-L-isoaspartate(D-aspartate) O-methyltransferase